MFDEYRDSAVIILKATPVALPVVVDYYQRGEAEEIRREIENAGGAMLSDSARAHAARLLRASAGQIQAFIGYPDRLTVGRPSPHMTDHP